MSDDVSVQIRTQRIIVEPTSRTVSVVSAGPQGPSGTAANGLPVGGTAGQVLSKINSTNYNTQWVSPGGVSDGDKGDIVVSGSGAIWDIDTDAIDTAMIADDAVTDAKLANVPTATFKGRKTAATGSPENMTATEATALLDAFSSALKGLAPASGGGTANFLRADGSWAAPAGTGGVSDGDKGDVVVSSSGTVWTVDANVIGLTKLLDIATNSILGRVTAATGDPEVLTVTQVTAMLNAFTSSLKGLVPSSGGGTANFLRADASWAAPPNTLGSDGDKGDITVGGTGTTLSVDDNVVTNAKLADIATARFKGRVTAATGDPEDLTGTQATTLLDVVTTSLKGLAPASGGGTANYLRADGTWAAPPGTSNYGPLVFTVPGALTVAAGTKRLYVGKAVTVANVTVGVNTAPTGASVIVDVNKNGTTMFTTQGNRPTIAASGFSDVASVPDVVSLAAGDYITVDVDQIGSTIAGSNLVISIEFV